MLLFNIIHICYSYRIEDVMEANIIKHITLKNGSLMHKQIIYAINIHREAMKLVSKFFKSFNISLYDIKIILYYDIIIILKIHINTKYNVICNVMHR